MPATKRPLACAPVPSIDLLAVYERRTHLDWGKNIARLIAGAKGLGPRSTSADDLVAVAHLTLVRLAPRFDVARVPPGGCADGLFRGLAHPWIKKECEREAERLVNAGAYHTTGDAELKAAARRTGELPAQARCPNCRDVAGWWDDEPEEPEEMAARHEPRLLILRGGVPVSLDGVPVADPGDGVAVECVGQPLERE